MSRNLFFFIAFLVFFVTGNSWGQKKRIQLEKQRQENQKKIAAADRILKETEKQKTANLGTLNALSEQVKSRKDIIADLNKELNIIQEEINTLSITISGLDKDLTALKDEYAAMVYAASKADIYDRLIFVFSSSTFNQFLARLNYLKQYSLARREQVQMMSKVRSNKLSQQRAMESKLREKEALLNTELSEKEKLLMLQNRQEEIIAKLGRKEKKLREEIAERKRSDAKLEKLIADLIRREIRRAERLARARAKEDAKKQPLAKKSDIEKEVERTEGKPTMELTPEATIISNNFSGNKGRIIWPVEAGFISSKFGRHKHPVLKEVIMDNLGIDIQTNENQSVRSVFDGEIGFVASVPGVNGKIVSVMHGDYFTVYSNLKEVNVKTGERVKIRQKIGEVYTDKEGVSTLQFQIWRNSDKLNPENWLVGK